MSHLSKSKVLFLRDIELDPKKYNVIWGSVQNQGIALRDLRATTSTFNDKVRVCFGFAVISRKFATK